jgi:L,D-transpeptidase YcbB
MCRGFRATVRCNAHTAEKLSRPSGVAMESATPRINICNSMVAKGMRRRAFTGIVVLMVLASSAGPGSLGAAAQGSTPTDDITDRIRASVDVPQREGAFFFVGDERLHAAAELPRFYRGRGFEPAWVSEVGPRAVADSLLWALEGAVLEGLDPDHYHVSRIREAYADVIRSRSSGRAPGATLLSELDLLLTDAFLVYASHLAVGRVDPTTIHPEWTVSRGAVDLVTRLDMALATGRVGGVLEELLPVHPAYDRLRRALAEHRRIAANGGWPMLPGRTLTIGTRDPAVALLRARLMASGDLAAPTRRVDEELFDGEVEKAVQRFQARHALSETGEVRLETSAVMNIPVEDRIRMLERNLERWRWLPQDLGERHILVNIAGLEMHVMEGDSSIFQSRVLVGQRYRKTPVFSDRMTYLVLNPTWTIPPGILEEDKLPLIRADQSYLARNNIQVLAANGRVVDPATIDFDRLTGRTGYRFRMDPGPENPLGKVKFMFPNPHHIYLHDTPDHDDFDRTGGAVSSGCIRVERSLELAEYLLSDSPGWDRARMEAAIQTPGERTVSLRRPLPIHILYWTAWVTPEGDVHFRPDIYDRDRTLDEALRQPPPSAMDRSEASGDAH